MHQPNDLEKCGGVWVVHGSASVSPPYSRVLQLTGRPLQQEGPFLRKSNPPQPRWF